ncbi:MAG: 5'-3' exonuclease H3TH domain-containing protein [Planctomycetota bacterium]
MNQVMNRWVIVDVSNWAHKLLHAAKGDPDRAMQIFEKWHDYVDVNVKPCRIVYAFDSPGGSFRKELTESYKSSRKPPPEGLAKLMTAVELFAIETCTEIVKAPGFEADDLIATVTRLAMEQASDSQVVICSTDKDLRQLLQQGRVVLATSVSINKGIEWFNERDLLHKFGLRPDQWIDYQTLVGDSTDDVKGCSGFGPQRSADLLKACGSLEGHFASPWRANLGDAARSKLLQFRSSGALNLARQLVTLRTDVPLGEGWEELIA